MDYEFRRIKQIEFSHICIFDESSSNTTLAAGR